MQPHKPFANLNIFLQACGVPQPIQLPDLSDWDLLSLGDIELAAAAA